MSLLTTEQATKIVEKMIMHPHYCNSYYQSFDICSYMNLKEFIKNKALLLSERLDKGELSYLFYKYKDEYEYALTPKLKEIISKDDEYVYIGDFVSDEFPACSVSNYFMGDFILWVLKEIDPEFNENPDYVKYRLIEMAEIIRDSPRD